ncbi:potassium-transporting ATPase subunit KdpC [soil metagenome]
MLTHLRPALVLFLLLSLITGVIYPLAVTGFAQFACPAAANGSLITASDGRVVGSSLIGQDFSSAEPASAARWFWSRPSATGPAPYTSFNADKATGSSGSNLAPSNPALVDNIKARIAALAAADSAVGIARPGSALIPIDLVTSSASGLDPHISPASAEYQLTRVAQARHLNPEALRAIVARHTTGRTFGLLGEPVVSVLELNLELNALTSP